MAKKSSWNPIAFVPAQVTVISSIVYIALFTILIWVHNTVPGAPSNPTPVEGVNLTQAWLDLEFVSNGYHPIDSSKNEAVRGYLVKKVEEILGRNGVDFKVVRSTTDKVESVRTKNNSVPKAVTVFEDQVSNITFVRNVSWTCYGESTNVMVYIRGTDDEDGGLVG